MQYLNIFITIVSSLLNRKHISSKEPLTAAQQSKAASLAAENLAERDGVAVTEKSTFHSM